MKPLPNIDPVLPQRALVTPREDRSQPVTKAKRVEREGTVSQETNLIVARWLTPAINAYGKQGSLAAAADILPPHLTEMKSGFRTIPARILVPLLREEKTRELALNPMAEFAGLAPVRHLRAVTKEEIRTASTNKMRSILQLWQVMRADIAADLGTTVGEIDAVLDEPDEVAK